MASQIMANDEKGNISATYLNLPDQRAHLLGYHHTMLFARVSTAVSLPAPLRKEALRIKCTMIFSLIIVRLIMRICTTAIRREWKSTTRGNKLAQKDGNFSSTAR
jgi:hypothetical protein